MFAWRGAAIGLGLVAALMACDEEATRPTPARVDINYEACLGNRGGADSTCPATLDAQAAAGQNGCLIIERTGQEFHLPFEWGGGGVITDRGTLDVTPGDTVSAALFVFSTADPGRCAANGLSFGASCSAENACLVRLSQTDVTIGDDNMTTFNFMRDGQCEIERADVPEFTEVCDDIDNDCDGVADEGLTLQGGEAIGEVCSVGVGKCARSGEVVCQAGAIACSGVAGMPVDEICDDADNDCDGSTDENIAVDNCCDLGTMRACGVAVGACTVGTETCVGEGAKGEFGTCVGMDGMPVVRVGDQSESCNDVDDDCDGEVDEDILLADADVIEPGDQSAELGASCLALDEGCQVTGEVRCGAGEVAECIFMRVMRGDEVCDGADNDCDGTLDEGFPGLGDACEVGIGACFQSGEIACIDTQTTGCNAPVIEPGSELCANMIDDDCDGTSDEGFDDLGVACSNGIGVCQVNGAFICSEMGNILVCDAEAGPEGVEVCDRLDNDCDGYVDEDFDTTTDSLNCGACGRNCDMIVNQSGRTAIAACELSECVIVECVDDFRDEDGLATTGCECNPGFLDLPDAAFDDRNCDGVDGDPDDAYFVSPQGDDLNPGAIDAPFATLAQALFVAANREKDIYLDGAIYSVTDGAQAPPNAAAVGLVVPPGVSIYGGYRYDGAAAWARGPLADFPTVITGAQRVLTYRGDRQEQVFLANVSIVAGPAVDYPNPTVGVVAIDVGDQLILRNVTIEAQDGAMGTTGDDGADASSLGASGAIGTSGILPQQAGLGGRGGRNDGCPGVGGGTGGDGHQDFDAQAGGEGFGAQPASGGPPGAPGVDGADGRHGNNSSGGEFVGRIHAETRLWIPRPGQPGLSGQPGGGGGGGGGGVANPGGGGGGGGAGGCFGSGGRTAQGGAMSVGLSITGGTVHLQSVTITSGAGGRGGRGGHGGVGELGLLGGLGGGGEEAAGDGGRGGRGGDGGCGGHAGGGGGGSSFAIFRASPSNVAADLENSQFVFEDYEGRAAADQPAMVAEFLISGLAGEGGDGGGGDERAQFCGLVADSGLDGISAPVGCCPVGVGANNCTTLTCD